MPSTFFMSMAVSKVKNFAEQQKKRRKNFQGYNEPSATATMP
jgi:hypothetical protein